MSHSSQIPPSHDHDNNQSYSNSNSSLSSSSSSSSPSFNHSVNINDVPENHSHIQTQIMREQLLVSQKQNEIYMKQQHDMMLMMKEMIQERAIERESNKNKPTLNLSMKIEPLKDASTPEKMLSWLSNFNDIVKGHSKGQDPNEYYIDVMKTFCGEKMKEDHICRLPNILHIDTRWIVFYKQLCKIIIALDSTILARKIRETIQENHETVQSYQARFQEAVKLFDIVSNHPFDEQTKIDLFRENLHSYFDSSPRMKHTYDSLRDLITDANMVEIAHMSRRSNKIQMGKYTVSDLDTMLPKNNEIIEYLKSDKGSVRVIDNNVTVTQVPIMSKMKDSEENKSMTQSDESIAMKIQVADLSKQMAELTNQMSVLMKWMIANGSSSPLSSSTSTSDRDRSRDRDNNRTGSDYNYNTTTKREINCYFCHDPKHMDWACAELKKKYPEEFQKAVDRYRDYVSRRRHRDPDWKNTAVDNKEKEKEIRNNNTVVFENILDME